MKKLLLFFVILVTVLFLVGCIPTADIKDIEVKVTGFEQDVFCGAKAFKIFNGEDYKCIPYCATCCPQCPECEQCQCQECPECSKCSPCCCSLKWGDLLVNFQMWNIGNVNAIVSKIYFEIKFEDGTKSEKQIHVGEVLLVGEYKDKQAEINLSAPVKRVVFVEIKSYEFY
jgi:hypothetical protein